MKNRSLDRHSHCHLRQNRFSRDWLKLLKAVLILFGTVFLVFMIFVWSVDAVSFDYSELTKPDRKMCDEAGSAMENFQKPGIEAANSAASKFLAPEKIEISGDTTGGIIMHDSSAPAPYAVHDNTVPSHKRMYYFFSFSMPHGILEDAVKDAIRLRKEGTDVVLAMRGLVGNDFKATIRKFYEFMEENGLNGRDLPVELNPQLFSTYSVNRVPFVIYEAEDMTGSISGVSVSHALSKFVKEVKDYGRYGTTWPIKEENLLEVIERRLKSPEVQNRIRSMLGKARDRMYTLTKYDGLIGKTEEERVYHIDPSLTLEEDILDHEGNVIAPKGTTVNPSDYAPLTGRYIFIDGNDDKQVAYALNGDFRKIIIISGNIRKLSGAHKHRFYFVNDDLIEKIRLTHVPAILESEGRYLRVTEKALD